MLAGKQLKEKDAQDRMLDQIDFHGMAKDELPCARSGDGQPPRVREERQHYNSGKSRNRYTVTTSLSFSTTRSRFQFATERNIGLCDLSPLFCVHVVRCESARFIFFYHKSVVWRNWQQNYWGKQRDNFVQAVCVHV